MQEELSALGERDIHRQTEDYAASWTRFVNQVIDQRLGDTSQLATRQATIRLIEEVCEEIAEVTGPLERMIRRGGDGTAIAVLRDELVARLDAIEARIDALEGDVAGVKRSAKSTR